MPRLPQPGSDNGNWGTLLNQFLDVEHNADGSLKLRTDGTLSNVYSKPAGGIAFTDLDASVQAKINSGGVTDDSISTAMIQNGAVITSKIADSTVTLTNLNPTLRSQVQGAVQSVNGKTGSTVSLALSDLSAPTASVSLNNQKIINLANPTTAQHAATKFYADKVASGFSGAIVYSVKDFGALGNGTADDFDAIQETIDVAVAAKPVGQQGVSIYFPPGNYRIRDEIVIPSGIGSVVGSGWETTTIMALSDFGAGKYLVRDDGSAGAHLSVRSIRLIGPSLTGPLPQMSGLRLPGGGSVAEEIIADHLHGGVAMMPGRSSLTNAWLAGNYYGLYFIGGPDTDSSHLIGWSDFASNSFASIGIHGAGAMYNTIIMATHLGFGPGNIYKESSAITGGNSKALVGCVLIDTGCEASSGCVIYCENNEQVANNHFINCSYANLTPPNAAVVCGDFSNNVMQNSSMMMVVGSAAGGVAIQSTGGTGNVVYSDRFIDPGKPLMTPSATAGLRWVTNTGEEGRLVRLGTGSSVASGNILGIDGGGQMIPYPAGSTAPVWGVAAQTESTPGRMFLMWETGGVKVTTQDAAVGADSWLIPDPAADGQVVKTTDPSAGQVIGFAMAGPSSGRVDARLKRR